MLKQSWPFVRDVSLLHLNAFLIDLLLAIHCPLLQLIFKGKAQLKDSGSTSIHCSPSHNLRFLLCKNLMKPVFSRWNHATLVIDLTINDS